MVIRKKFKKDFEGQAVTLSVSEVTSDTKAMGGRHTRTHRDGWQITGEIHEDYYTWVNEFEAVHPILGRVWGNFETIVYADSKEGYNDFYEKHTPRKWDYQDI